MIYSRFSSCWSNAEFALLRWISHTATVLPSRLSTILLFVLRDDLALSLRCEGLASSLSIRRARVLRWFQNNKAPNKLGHFRSGGAFATVHTQNDHSTFF